MFKFLNKTKRKMAQLVGKTILWLEDIEDKKAIKKIDFSKGRDFEEFAKKLGI